jgi:hypothetical protein
LGVSKLSTVVPFRSRDLIIPKGIDGGEMLAWASADELLALHLQLTSDAKAFWKDGFLLYTLWATGDFCGMLPPRKRSTLYPYTRSGFYQFLRDHGSQISPEETDWCDFRPIYALRWPWPMLSVSNSVGGIGDSKLGQTGFP